jgi:hypothetical protein
MAVAVSVMGFCLAFVALSLECDFCCGCVPCHRVRRAVSYCVVGGGTWVLWGHVGARVKRVSFSAGPTNLAFIGTRFQNVE